MYLDPPQTILCQGDVIADFPYPVLSDIQFRKRDFVGQLRIKSGPLIIVSHDCDLELYAGVPKRLAVQLCPLAPIPKHVRANPDGFERLKANLVSTERPEYINLFFLASAVGTLDEDMIADLSLIHSLPSSPALLETLLLSKKLQLSGQSKALLQEKLMYQYGRDAR